MKLRKAQFTAGGTEFTEYEVKGALGATVNCSLPESAPRAIRARVLRDMRQRVRKYEDRAAHRARVRELEQREKRK